MGRFKVILLDTCTVLWRSFEKTQLSLAALQTIDSTKETTVSSISIWEIGIKIKKKKLEFPMGLGEIIERIKSIEGVNIIPIDENIWIEALNLKWNHQDPADRVIVATAKRLSCPIVTSDKTIRSFYKKIIW